ncbi:MAG: amidohydrolase family protein [Candidatus Eisenbacteria bacterium]|uniref:Amidohydrolase family protein n=1 Tax=Eiseniibacteriota bacterium TaxID=2212470 RepID=A0A933SIM4_UNCEI|nr:amidohydrolase family protein [Candidatus Eisenbacteria bacterium]
MSSAPRTPAALARRLTAAALALAAACTFCRAPEAFAGTPRVHALTHARIVLAPGQVIERGTIVVRDGLVTAVGADVAIPADARVWEMDSLTVYAGLVDAFVMPAEDTPAGPPRLPGGGGRPRAPQTDTAEPARGAASGLPSVRSEYRMIENLALSADQLGALRAAGFTVAQVSPRRGIVRGTSAVVGLGDGPANANALVADASMIAALDPQPQGYPGSLMGAIAVARQTFLDARWYRDANAAYAKKPAGTPRPETNLSWAALQGAIAGTQQVQFVADEMLEVLRSAALMREAGLAGRIVTGGDEYKRVALVAATGFPLVVPVAFPDAPDVSTADLAADVATETLRQWQEAPGNAAALAKAGVTFAFTTNGLRDVKVFAENVGKAVQRGLSADAALAAVTTVPAKMLGLDARIGTIAPGKLANFTVTRGTLFAGGKVREVWVDGNRYEAAKDETAPTGDWVLDWGKGTVPMMVGADKDTTVKLVFGADTVAATAVSLDGKRLRFTLTREKETARVDLRAANDALAGTMNGAAGQSVAVRGTPAEKKDRRGDKKPDAALVASPAVMGNSEPWRMAIPEQQTVLVRNATIWTAGPQGTLEGADLLVQNDRIVSVGRNLAAPKGALVYDATGKHVAPGIIDEHSHAAVLGNVNECTNNVTCEVRIQDVINSESPNIYRQLAGGVTAMHLLHGSCNAIGGQCAVIRNKWGASPDQLFMSEAPGTVKFALGENPKQSNWEPGDVSSRYPHSRGGVEQSIREAFLAARDYDRAWAEWRAGQRALPPRRDIQLDALSEIVAGKRLIHCHSYRQDEILMLMRLAEEFGFRVNTFTHILEGYKVADEMAAHGASGMGFTDWWQYKQEVIDAIPWNAYLMWDRGVNVGFNSDSEELARRLNTEAGKAIKYGGMPPEEAIRTVTLNPAKSLKIDGRVGSLEPGKDADFAIWSGVPLSPYSVCEQTWVEGRKYFDRAADLAGRGELARERDALIAAARAAKADAPMAGGRGRGARPPRYLEDTDQSGNHCGEHQGHSAPFRSEAARDQQGEEVSR